MPIRLSRRTQVVLGGLAAVTLAGGLITAESLWTAPVRGALRTYADLIAAAHRQDLGAVAACYSRRWLRIAPPVASPEGGVVGIPRNLPHKNFRAWRHGPHVRLCPSNRVGPVFQFVHEDGRWRFDGPIGLLRPGGRFVPIPAQTGGQPSTLSPRSRPSTRTTTGAKPTSRVLQGNRPLKINDRLWVRASAAEAPVVTFGAVDATVSSYHWVRFAPASGPRRASRPG